MPSSPNIKTSDNVQQHHHGTSALHACHRRDLSCAPEHLAAQGGSALPRPRPPSCSAAVRGPKDRARHLKQLLSSCARLINRPPARDRRGVGGGARPAAPPGAATARAPAVSPSRSEATGARSRLPFPLPALKGQARDRAGDDSHIVTRSPKRLASSRR